MSIVSIKHTVHLSTVTILKKYSTFNRNHRVAPLQIVNISKIKFLLIVISDKTTTKCKQYHCVKRNQNNHVGKQQLKT